MVQQNLEAKLKKKCTSTLEAWVMRGVVIDYDDVSGLGKHFNTFTGRWTMHTKKGKRDVIAWFRAGNMLWTYLIECKVEGSSQRPEQVLYEAKWKGLRNVIYEVVYDKSQINMTIDRITNYTKLKLDEAENHLFGRKIMLKVKKNENRKRTFY